MALGLDRQIPKAGQDQPANHRLARDRCQSVVAVKRVSFQQPVTRRSRYTTQRKNGEHILEDEDTKIRRNLVMVSSAILVSAWLHIPLLGVWDKLFQVSKPDDWKVWVVEFALLIYLGLRYRFSDEGSHYVTTAASELDTIRRHRATDFAQSEANRLTKTGVESPIFKGELSTLISHLTKDRPQVANDMRPEMLVTLVEQSQSAWEFTIGVAASWDTKGGGSTAHSGNTLKVFIEGRARWRVECMSRLHLWTYTESSIRYLVPVFLGLLATLVLLLKEVTAFVLPG